jgi:hypothetical protein
MLSYFVIVLWLFFFNVGWLISYQNQVNCWTGFSCKISLLVIQIWWSIYYSLSWSHCLLVISCKISLPAIQIWSSHFCLAIIVWESIVAIVVFGIGTRQGCKLFKVVPPHLILVAWICICIINGSLDWVIEALKQIDWFYIKFKSTVCQLSLARFLFQSSKFGHHISVWQL